MPMYRLLESKTVSERHDWLGGPAECCVMSSTSRIPAVCVMAALLGTQARAESTSSREYQVKAAFLYKFLMFVDWPKEKMPDNRTAMVIGIVGEDPFGDAFEPVKDQQVKGRKVVVKRVKGLEELRASDKAEMDQAIEVMRGCDLLFVCGSEGKTAREITDIVKGYSVLTVADTPGFIESGGMIDLTVEEQKIKFEINNAVANDGKLKIGSQLLRLAKRVIEEKPQAENVRQNGKD